MKLSEREVNRIIEELKSRKSDFKTTPLYDANVELSEDAEFMRELRNRIMQIPEVRSEIVLKIKEQVERGEYNVSTEDIVDSMIRRAIGDSIR